MHDETRHAILPFTEYLEGKPRDERGYVLYLDAAGLVTIGIGNLVDPPNLLAGIEFVRPNGERATPSEISQAWLAVHNAQAQRGIGGAKPFWKTLTSIRATEASIAALCDRKLTAAEAIALHWFPEWESWPWKAQLGVLSMIWAMGDEFARFPHFVAACRDLNWAAAAVECHMSEVGNAPLAERNRMNRFLFEDAAREETGTRYVELAEMPWVKAKNEVVG